MKRNPYTSCLPTLALCGAVLGAQAEEPRQASGKPIPKHLAASCALGQVIKADQLIGTDVKNFQSENLGEIEDLAVDLAAGRVVEVVLSPGLFGRDVAIPPAAFTCEPSADDSKAPFVRLNADKSKLKGSPDFPRANWSEAFQPSRVAETYHYYGVPTYFTPSGDARHPDPLRTNYWDRLGRVDKASKVIGMTVKNPQGESVGKVDNLLIDLPAGRVVQVLVSAGGFLGIGDTLNGVPPAAFGRDLDRDHLVLNVTKDQLKNAPRHRADETWNSTNRVWAVDSYRFYQIEPYFQVGVDADNTKRNMADRHDRAVTPFDQGSSDADVATTRNIRKAIREQDTLSVNAQNVKVITRGGQVTLRGPVENEQERQTLATIAARYAPAGRTVDNQLEVKQSTPKN